MVVYHIVVGRVILVTVYLCTTHAQRVTLVCDDFINGTDVYGGQTSEDLACTMTGV